MLTSAIMKTVYVVALGQQNNLLGYLISKSRKQLDDYTDIAVFRGNIQHGKVVRMTYDKLSEYLPGFNHYGQPCVEAGGTSLVGRGKDGKWEFDCGMETTRVVPGRLPPAREIKKRFNY